MNSRKPSHDSLRLFRLFRTGSAPGDSVCFPMRWSTFPAVFLVSSELVFDDLGIFAGGQGGVPHEQGHLVVLVQGFPKLFRQRIGAGCVQSDPLRLALEGGEGIAVAHVGVDEAALAGEGMVIGVEIAVAAAGIAVGGFQNGELEAAVGGDQAGDAGRVVGAVRLELPGVEGGGKGLARQQAVPDGVGLVAIGDDQAAVQLPYGMVDNETGVRHFGGIVSLGADAVFRDGEHPVPGVFTAAHNEVGSHGVLVVGAAAQNDAPAGVGIAFQQLSDVQLIHVAAPLS